MANEHDSTKFKNDSNTEMLPVSLHKWAWRFQHREKQNMSVVKKKRNQIAVSFAFKLLTTKLGDQSWTPWHVENTHYLT